MRGGRRVRGYLTSFPWSGPKGSVERVVDVARKQGRDLAEHAAMDQPLPWQPAYEDELTAMLVVRMVALAVPFSRFSSDPAALTKGMQDIAAEAFRQRRDQLMAAATLKGNA